MHTFIVLKCICVVHSGGFKFGDDFGYTNLENKMDHICGIETKSPNVQSHPRLWLQLKLQLYYRLFVPPPPETRLEFIHPPYMDTFYYHQGHVLFREMSFTFPLALVSFI